MHKTVQCQRYNEYEILPICIAIRLVNKSKALSPLNEQKINREVKSAINIVATKDAEVGKKRTIIINRRIIKELIFDDFIIIPCHFCDTKKVRQPNAISQKRVGIK